MNAINQAFRKQLAILRNYPVAALIVLFSCSMIIYNGYITHRLLYGFGYVFAVWLGALITDMVTGIRPRPAIGFPIKKPVKQEVFVILLSTILGVIFLAVRFHTHWSTLPPLIKLAIFPLILFVFPVIIALIYLFRYKYKPKELGINVRYWYLALFIHLIVGSITLWVAPDRSHWKEAINQMGIPALLFTGLISAALPEEFLRMLFQTRLGAAFKNAGLGFVTATFIWAAMHIPKESEGEKVIDWAGHFMRTFTLMPIGFLWGYITHRTKSLIPSILVHGFNLWGLQNVM